MGPLRRILKWWRGRWLCECFGVNVKDAHYWSDMRGGKLCDDCIEAPCHRIIWPEPVYWVHRVGVS